MIRRTATISVASLLLLGLFFIASYAQAATTENYGGRDMLVTVPSQVPPPGSRALVIVLHGGFGNAAHIESQSAEAGINLDAEAQKDGFVVAYLNGTPVARLLGAHMLGWNAGGGCCGLPGKNNTDDVAYISGAVDYLANKYGIDRHRVYGIGHSNGAMMVQRMICETNVLSAGVAISGPLMTDAETCPNARGKRILAIHGADDTNVPIAGGAGRGFAGAPFKSEDYAQKVMTRSGASYTLDVVTGADHYLLHLETAVEKRDGVSIAEKSVRFFGVAK